MSSKADNEAKTSILPPLPEDITNRLKQIVRVAGEETEAKIAIATQKSDQGLLVRASLDNPHNPLKVDQLIPNESNLFCLKVVRTKSVLHVDETTEPEEASHYVGVPIYHPDGQVFGSLAVKDSKLQYGIENSKRLMVKLSEMITEELMGRAI